MSERRQDIHVHVDRDDARTTVDPTLEHEYADEEMARAASFFTAQLLWILIIAIIVVLIVAALGSSVVELGGSNGAADPTAAP